MTQESAATGAGEIEERLREDFSEDRKDHYPGEVIDTYERERHEAAADLAALRRERDEARRQREAMRTGWREECEFLRSQAAQMAAALRHALEAIETGRSEPLFVARDNIRNTLDDLAAPAPATGGGEMEHEPVAWLHTLHMEHDQTEERLTFSNVNAFGDPGRDYSEEYEVTIEPLFLAAPASAASSENAP